MLRFLLLFFVSVTVCGQNNLQSLIIYKSVNSDNTIILNNSFSNSESIKIDIFRQNNVGCLSGYISIMDEIIGYTVERPDVDNINDISAIPAGTYSAHIRNDGKLKWRLELENVPERENVQIHVGNYINVIDDKTGFERCSIKGCIIIGEKLGDDLCSVFNSKKALNKLKDKIEQVIIPIDSQIIVSIQ